MLGVIDAGSQHGQNKRPALGFGALYPTARIDAALFRQQGREGVRYADRKPWSLRRLATVSAFILGLLGAGETVRAADAIAPGSADFPRAFSSNKLMMVEGETKGFLDPIAISGDNAQIDTVKSGFKGPVSLWRVGGTVYVLATRSNTCLIRT
jgi:hypothetical protein